MRGGYEEQEKPDLLVFGYACKLFRDDEKASLMDAGTHLIPWMGDNKLKIDRYDGRGALYDLKSYEPKDNYDFELNEEDQAIEQLCEHERYRSLFINEEEEATYREETAKRKNQGQGYGEVSYNYDVPNRPEDSNESVPSKPFVAPPELDLPPNMKVPDTVKHNAIIERTALFLAQQGSQMEILMKVKQQGNKNFDFLSHTDPLHEYYKHLKELIKSGSYVPKEQEGEDEENESEDHYLHPSLVPKVAEPAPPPPVAEEVKPPSAIIYPPDYVRNIVEKMVNYVVRNGPRFEAAIRKRNDVRFSFLIAKNPYNPYYRQQLEIKHKLIAVTKKLSVRPKEEPKRDESQESRKRKPLPVCFSIKKPKESEGLEVLSALPVEESSDDDSASGSPRSVDPDSVTSLEKRIRKSTEITNKHKQKKDAVLQNERKMKVAQFLKGLKKK